jgi:uncharacterized protein (DUF1697 family)
VGGKNVIKMGDLKACFEEIGFQQVTTYIQSGNVLFDSDNKDVEKLGCWIEMKLSERFDYQSKVVLIRQATIGEIIANAPEGFGSDPGNYRYDVIFLKGTLKSEEALSRIKIKEGVDFVAPGKGVIYFSRLSSKSTQSQMTKMIGTPIYREMTIRNWNTTRKLSEL